MEVPFWSLDDEDFDHAYEWPRRANLPSEGSFGPLAERITWHPGVAGRASA